MLKISSRCKFCGHKLVDEKCTCQDCINCTQPTTE